MATVNRPSLLRDAKEAGDLRGPIGLYRIASSTSCVRNSPEPESRRHRMRMTRDRFQPKPIAYREARNADLDQLARLRADEWGSESYWGERILGYLRGTHHPQQALAPRVVLVASRDHTLVGFIAGHLTRRYDCDGELEWLNVASEARRSGVAGALLRLLASWFAGQGAKRVCVDVDPENGPARGFYRKHGAQDLNPHWLVWPGITSLSSEA